MARKIYHASILDCDGHVRPIYGECEITTGKTLERILSWCSKWGHALLDGTYHEKESEDNPAFVDSCLADVAGFKR